MQEWKRPGYVPEIIGRNITAARSKIACTSNQCRVFSSLLVVGRNTWPEIGPRTLFLPLVSRCNLVEMPRCYVRISVGNACPIYCCDAVSVAACASGMNQVMCSCCAIYLRVYCVCTRFLLCVVRVRRGTPAFMDCYYGVSWLMRIVGKTFALCSC